MRSNFIDVGIPPRAQPHNGTPRRQPTTKTHGASPLRTGAHETPRLPPLTTINVPRPVFRQANYGATFKQHTAMEKLAAATMLVHAVRRFLIRRRFQDKHGNRARMMAEGGSEEADGLGALTRKDEAKKRVQRRVSGEYRKVSGGLAEADGAIESSSKTLEEMERMLAVSESSLGSAGRGATS